MPIKLPNGDEAVNRKEHRNVLEHSIATEVGSLLQSVVRVGTGTRAQVANVVIAGKTGTTEGYGDAWFVGWTPKYTVAVWVGYPNEFKSMETEFNGQPVAGGTYPAAIFRTFIEGDLRNNPPKVKETPTPTAPAPGADRHAAAGRDRRAADRRHRRARADAGPDDGSGPDHGRPRRRRRTPAATRRPRNA